VKAEGKKVKATKLPPTLVRRGWKIAFGKDDSLREWDGWMIRMGSFGTDDKDRDGTK